MGIHVCTVHGTFFAMMCSAAHVHTCTPKCVISSYIDSWQLCEWTRQLAADSSPMAFWLLAPTSGSDLWHGSLGARMVALAACLSWCQLRHCVRLQASMLSSKDG